MGNRCLRRKIVSAEYDKVINTFFDLGYDEFDTAFVYNEGNCERLLGDVLPKLDKIFRIASKINPRISGKLDGEAAYKQVLSLV